MNSSTQLNITIPDKLNYYHHNNKHSLKIIELDNHHMLQLENRRILEAIFGTIDAIVGDAPIHLIQHEPATGMLNHYEPFNIGHMLALQDQIPYSMIDSIPISIMDEREKEKTRKALQERNVAFEDLEKAINSKLIQRITVKTLPAVKEYIAKITQKEIIPVHFSGYNIELVNIDEMELPGLHIHLYSNHIIEEDFKSEGSYNEVNKVLNMAWADKQRYMFQHYLKKLPSANLKFLEDPCDSWNTILAYHIK